MSADIADRLAEAHRQTTEGSGLRAQLLLTGILTTGAIFAGTAYTIAQWLVGLFATTLPLPAGTTLSVTVAFYAGIVYLAVFETDADGQTLFGRVLGRVAA